MSQDPEAEYKRRGHGPGDLPDDFPKGMHWPQRGARGADEAKDRYKRGLAGIPWLGSPNYTGGHLGYKWVVLHTMVGTIDSANARFQQPGQQASAHYGVAANRMVQWVDEGDTAWHAGVWSVNQQSVGIEHQDDGNYNSPRPDALYANSIRLVSDICQRHGIPRSHGNVALGVPGIISHRETGYATACPDSLDTDRIIRGVAQPTPPPQPQEDEESMPPVFHGDQRPACWRWVAGMRMYLAIMPELNFWVARSPKGLESWPQYIVDRMPVILRVPEDLSGTGIKSYDDPVYMGRLAASAVKLEVEGRRELILTGEAARQYAANLPAPAPMDNFPY